MKFSYNWLSELIPGLSLPPQQLERAITMKTAECEGIEAFAAALASVQTVRVISVEPLPKNRLATIQTAKGEEFQVVCGAPNVRAGLLTVWAPPGSTIQGRSIGQAKFGAVVSNGMLVSAAELGIGGDASGIIELTSETELGTLRPDWIIEIDNKSLTHRPDLWGHLGMAREVAAISGGTLRDPVDASVLPGGESPVRVEIEDFGLCPRYSALLVEDISVGPSPLWLESRLHSVGLNAISNIVDLTNYILAELPQPMHAFDADKLHGDTIFVRHARAGETLKALNGETYTLSGSDLVIADAAGPIALAGVIGGADSAISASTKRVVFESANFHAATVRLTSVRHKLRTDASMRFEKSLDPENTVRGLARALMLLRDLSPTARTIGGVADNRSEPAPLPRIPLNAEWISRKLGEQISQERIESILHALGFTIENGVVTVPSWRATKDVSMDQDLVEEIGRIIGYSEITPTAPLVASVVPFEDPFRVYQRRIRKAFAAQGFTEVSNYSFVSEAELKRLSMDASQHVGVRNPIAAEQTHLRASLLPGLLRNLESNVRHLRDFRLFEIGHEIHSRGDLPEEIPHAAALLYGQHATDAEFFELKRVLECVFPGARCQAADPKPYEHPTRTASITQAATQIGRIFELHPSLMQELGMEGRAVILDVDLRAAHTIAATETKKYRPASKYPSSGFDLSILAQLHEPVGVIEDRLRSAGDESITEIEFIRQYSGPPLAEGVKSVSYHVEAASPDHTLTADEVSAIRNRLIESMRAFGYDLRV